MLTRPNGNGQNPKPLRERRRKPKAAIKPTWPNTADQRKQSRPLIVARPVRRLTKGRFTPVTTAGAVTEKHKLDAAALRGYL